MEPADELVHNLFLPAHGGEIPRETVLIVDHLPDHAPIVLCESLFIQIYVKILSLIIFQIFHVPNPDGILSIIRLSLVSPKVTVDRCLHCLVCFRPLNGDILLITSADIATPAITHLDLGPERTLLLEIDSNDPKELGLCKLRYLCGS